MKPRRQFKALVQHLLQSNELPLYKLAKEKKARASKLYIDDPTISPEEWDIILSHAYPKLLGELLVKLRGNSNTPVKIEFHPTNPLKLSDCTIFRGKMCMSELPLRLVVVPDGLGGWFGRSIRIYRLKPES